MLGGKWRRGDEKPDPPRTPGRAAALVVGGLPAFAFPAPSWWWLAWFGLTPLLLVVRAAPTAREGGVRAGWGLDGFVLVTPYWPLPSAGPLLAVLAAGLGALWVPWGWAAHRLLSDSITLRGTLAAVAVLPSAGAGRGGAIVAPSRRALGFARRVAVESARHAGVGLP